MRRPECTRPHVLHRPLETPLHVCTIPPVGAHVIGGTIPPFFRQRLISKWGRHPSIPPVGAQVKMGPPVFTTFRTSWFPVQSYKEISVLNTNPPARILLRTETGAVLRTPSYVVTCCEHASVAGILRERMSALCDVTIARRYIVVHGRAPSTRQIARSQIVIT